MHDYCTIRNLTECNMELPEVVAQRCSLKKVFFEISHKIHRKASVPESLFQKGYKLRPAALLK